MPELPEVQTIVDGLQSSVAGQIVRSCRINRPSIIKSSPEQFVKEVKGRIIEAVERKGKYLVFTLSGGIWMVVHLRMTGKFIVVDEKLQESRYHRVIFSLDGGKELVFHDVRCFGTIELTSDLGNTKGLKRLGMDPWDKSLNGKRLMTLLTGRTTAIKTALLNQEIIAGLGNIYASEILFDAKINPNLEAGSLTLRQANRMIKSMRGILELALIHNGTSISDFRRVDDKTGSFQNFLKVYGKTGHPCVTCGSLIIKQVISQRSTFLCPKCQKK